MPEFPPMNSYNQTAKSNSSKTEDNPDYLGSDPMAAAALKAANAFPQSKLPDIKEGKLYDLSFRKIMPIFIVGYSVSLFVIYQGLQKIKLYPAVSDPYDPMHCRYTLGFLPIIIAILIIGLLTKIILKNKGRRIGITKSYFLYRNKRGSMEMMPWETVVLNAPIEHDVNFNSIATITDGKNTVQIEKYYYKDFEEICQHIQNFSKAARQNI